jgi:hypothetical protein
VLPENETARLEEQYFADPALGDDIAAIEDDLLDDYVRGELSAEERQWFEEHYLASAAHRQRAAMAVALRAASAGHDPGATVLTRTARDSRWWTRTVERLSQVPTPLRWSAVAAAILVGLVWWATAIAPGGQDGAQSQQAQSDTPQQSLPRIVTPEPTKQPDGSPPSSPTPANPSRTTRVTFLLAQVVTRSDGPSGAFVVPAGVDEIELRFPGNLQVPSGSAVAEIRTPDDVLVWRGPTRSDASATGERATAAVVPQNRLPSGDYLVSVFSTAEPNVALGRYSMRITRH